jgi:hypothetical protein
MTHPWTFHSGVHDTDVLVTAISMTLRCISQRCHWHRCSTNVFSNIFANNQINCFYKEIRLSCTRHSGVNDTAGTCAAVSLTPVWHAQRYQWHRCDFGLHIPETLATFKGNIYRKIKHRQIVLHYFYSFHTKIWGLTRDVFGHSGVIDTAVTKIGEFVVDFLREKKVDSIFKKALTRSSGA